MIKRFKELSDAERKNLYEFMISFGSNHYFSNFSEFIENYTGPVFNYGEYQLSFWDTDQVIASLAMITQDVEKKREVFITSIYSSEEFKEKLKPFVMKALDLCRELKPERVKLGIYQALGYLVSVIKEMGFRQVFHSLVMQYQRNFSGNQNPDHREWELVFLAETNKLIYKEISDRAFLASPNGGILTDEILHDLLDKNKKNPEMSAMLIYQNKPVGIFDLTVKKGVGWIKSLAVHPDFQGKGFGKILLKIAIDQLSKKGAQEVKLHVISSNQKAVHLYENSGFVREKVTSTWFELEMT